MSKEYDKYLAEIEHRGFETTWMNGYPGDGWAKAHKEEIELIEKRRGMRLYGADSWKKYSRNCSYPIHLRYLAGMDDGQSWAVRVPSTCETIDDAINWITPAAVQKAKKEKRFVKRQGDCYIVELKSGKDNITNLPNSHKLLCVGPLRVFYHHEHKTIRVPKEVKAVRVYRQSQINGNGRKYAD